MISNYPVGAVSLPAGIKLLRNVYLTMRDGVKLAMDVYLPEKDGRYPVILGVCPYKKEAQAYSPNDGFHSEGGDFRFYVPRGYAMAFVTVRGAGYSQGKFTLLGRQEQEDGYDIVEGIARQPWCDGNVGMFGGSYLGMSQYYVAAQRPPHLKCITPCDASTDFYRDFVYQTGGMLYRAFIGNWGVNLTDELQFPGPIEGKEPPPNLYLDWLSNYLDGPYYRERSMIHLLDRIEVPVLAVVSGSGWLHSRGMLRGLQKIKPPVLKVVVAPSVYGTMFSTMYWHNERFNSYIVRWLDHWLKGVDTGILAEPPVMVFDGGSGEWRYENEVPPVERTRWIKLYFRSSSEGHPEPLQKLLSAEPPMGSEDPDTYESRVRRGAAAASVKRLVYATAPLEEDLKLWGPLSATIYGAISTENTSLWAWFVRVGEIAPDGTVKLISKGTLKACYREVDESLSTPQQPWHPFTKAEYLKPNTVYDFLIEIQPVFHTFRKGHRLFVQVASDDADFKVDNFSDPVAGPYPAIISVFHDAEHPSHLLVPTVPDAPKIRQVDTPPF